MKYDVLLLHPPSIYDFRKKAMFPGPIALTVTQSTSQFITIPVGLISIADLLDRNGFKVAIFNLGDLMLTRPDFNVERFIQNTEASIYAIDLHWCVHCQGAIEIARLCKGFHPSSFVVLGGLTATRFHEEILQKFPFVDIVVRGEGEDPMLCLARNANNEKELSKIQNLTHRGSDGRIHSNPLCKPCETLDKYEFARLDLLEPKRPANEPVTRSWNIPVCRGCTYNCASCGGSKHGYKTLMGRETIALRSPSRIVEDLTKLAEQGIRNVFIFQDPRMGGKEYWNELVSCLRNERPDITRLSMELFEPADVDFLREASSTGIPVGFNISPESGDQNVRTVHGRDYSNADILRTAKLCRQLRIPLGVFFMLGLAEETSETVNTALDLSERLLEIDRRLRTDLKERRFESPVLLKPQFGVMILLDPGSLAFDFPEKFGYRLLLKNFEDYYLAMCKPSWHQWISYETKSFSVESFIKLVAQVLERALTIEEKFSLYESPSDVASVSVRHFRIRSEHALVKEVDSALQSKDPEEMKARLNALQELFLLPLQGSFLYQVEDALRANEEGIQDQYGYRRKLRQLIHESVGLMTGS